MTASLTPPLKWHGGKQYLARRIVALMPPHLHYVEPFAGGLAVLFDKPCEDVSEVVNDLNGRLTNFWEVLKVETRFAKFVRLAEATPFSEAAWKAARDYVDDPKNDSVERAYNFFVLCRQSLAGRLVGFAPITKTRLRRRMNEQASAWLGAVEGLADVHARLKRVVILNRPALDVIKSQDGPDTLFYLDPPYVHETRATTHEYGEHEMAFEEHERLLDKLAAIEGKFLLSGYANPLYDSFAKSHGWDRVEFDLPNHAAAGASKRRMVEVVWKNF
jgi:DNA adenine methylase